MKNYRLNYDWLNYKKGHVFEADKDGDICGVLTLIEDEKVELPEEIAFVSIPHKDFEPDLIIMAINQIIRYLKARES